MPMLATSLPEQLFRIAAIYLFTVLMLRLAGKRRLAQLSPADLIIIIALGSAVGDVLVYPESVISLADAAIAIVVVVGLQILVSKAVEHNPALGRLVEGNASLVISRGKPVKSALEAEDMTSDDLMEMLRSRGVELHQVRAGYVERSGDLGLVLYSGRPTFRRGRMKIKR